jgi:hypothetical protein
MTSPDQLRPAGLNGMELRIERLQDCSVEFFRFLYEEVGRAYRWTDRLSWSDEMVQDHLTTPGVSIWLLSWENQPAG